MIDRPPPPRRAPSRLPFAALAAGVAGVAFLAFPLPAPAESRPEAAPGGPVVLLEVRGEPQLLADRLAGPGLRIRLAGQGWALVEASAGDAARIEAALGGAGIAHRRLREAAPPVELVQVRESELTPEERLAAEPFTLLHHPGEDLRVLALPPAGRAGLGADVHPLPAALPARALAAMPAAERANPYRRSRLGDPAARARMLTLAGQVDPDRIRSLVTALSTGPGSTRYSGRSAEMNAFVVPTLLDSLRAIFSAPGDTVFAAPFQAHVDSDTSEVELVNLIARRPGGRPGSGRYILGAHYDSIARRTEGWDPYTQPAPGADDNASGVASVLESARVLAGASFDFDLEVALFGGEEQVLLGSKAYAADTLNHVADGVLGAIVLDMVGYNPRAADSLNLLTNLNSEWLADLVRDSEAALGPENGLDEFDKIVRPTLTYSDHASFWNEGASAVLLIENTEIAAHNPNYHRVTDTVEMLTAVDGWDLARRAAEIAVAALGQFATPAEPGFYLPGSGLLVFKEDGSFSVAAVVGETMHARARVINTGAARGPVDVHAALDLGGTVVAERDTSFASWGAGVWYEVVVPWTPAVGQEGLRVLRAVLTVRENGSTLASLSDAVPFEVVALGVRDVRIVPNPVRGSLEAGRLELLRLTGVADLRCLVRDALGADVGRFEGQVGPGQRLALSQVVGKPDLASGIYLLHIEARVPGGGPVVVDERLTFAYMR